MRNDENEEETGPDVLEATDLMASDMMTDKKETKEDGGNASQMFGISLVIPYRMSTQISNPKTPHPWRI